MRKKSQIENAEKDRCVFQFRTVYFFQSTDMDKIHSEIHPDGDAKTLSIQHQNLAAKGSQTLWRNGMILEMTRCEEIGW